ncbi:hypothetical protein OO184_17255 [Photorhabdus sp. APURE]|uniref:hypothetical protein n=1 Tax=Photorhabdus aballayi TaxID=2991723 RepID=UPI00223DD608|nr:hypothetical protein [Photorhabdus aballayi]MCW7549631.1 hypothetical protein [Photorhabdus aballayi]
MKQRLKYLLKKWFPIIHPLLAKRLARWEKEILVAPPDIKDKETIKHAERSYCLNDFFAICIHDVFRKLICNNNAY